MLVCLSHGGSTVYESEGHATSLAVATAKGVVFLVRDTASAAWRESHRGLTDFHVIGLAHERISNMIVATMHDGGIAVSDDGGRTWQDRSAGVPSKNVYCVTIAYRSGRPRLYVGTEPARLYSSDDLGRSWREHTALRDVPSVSKWTFPAPPHDAHVINVTVDPTDPDRVFACVEQGGLFRSADGGETWTELLGFNDDVHRLMILNKDRRQLVMPTGYGFYRSSDSGDSWQDQSDRIQPVGYPDPMVIDPRREDVMVLAGGEADPFHWMQEKTARAHILRSTDGGLTWRKPDSGLPERFDASFEAMALCSRPGASSVYAGNTAGEVWSSDDDGASWRRIADGLPPVSKTIHYLILGHDLSFDKKERPNA